MKIASRKLFRSSTTLMLGLALTGNALSDDKGAYPFDEHIDQFEIKNYPHDIVQEWGDILFRTHFNAVDGVGTNLKEDPSDAVTKRFTRGPRADLPGWISNPVRPDGPQAQSCVECHGERTGNVLNEERDPLRSGQIKNYIERQATNINGVGALQLLAEQTSRELWQIRDQALASAASTGTSTREKLVSSNGIEYGFITAHADGSMDLSEVEGVDTTTESATLSMQLRVAPFHLKGVAAFLRQFSTATDITIGMQSPERFPDFIDVDKDGVVKELTVGDMTAMTVAMAGQARPVTRLELHRHVGYEFRLSRDEIRNIKKGKALFNDVGCTDCHKQVLKLNDPIFREPTSTPGFQFTTFWSTWINENGELGGGNPLDYGYDINDPYTFNIAENPAIKCRKYNARRFLRPETAFTKSRHQPPSYSKGCWRQYQTDQSGAVIVELYGDQKRHDMGEGLAEDIDEFKKGPSVWRTKELWGVASTAPWIHDGRATTLEEAIRWHGGEGADSRGKYFDLDERQQEQVMDFLKNLVIYDFKRGIILNSDNYNIWN